VRHFVGDQAADLVEAALYGEEAPEEEDDYEE
jgi:hypothetical protein